MMMGGSLKEAWGVRSKPSCLPWMHRWGSWGSSIPIYDVYEHANGDVVRKHVGYDQFSTCQDCGKAKRAKL